MLSGADLHQALQAGLWEALADESDRAAMRGTCRDARDMADALYGTAVLPVGPGTWDSGGAVASYHRRLGAVRKVHVEYSGSADHEEEARAAHFMEAYSTALGGALPAADCSIEMTYGRPARQLPVPLAAVLLLRVVPRVERLDMALASCANLVQLLQALEPYACLCSLKLLPLHHAEGIHTQDARIGFEQYPEVLDALCRLARLHTLSGPWVIAVPDLQRLCDALPSLTTLGLKCLYLHGAPGPCISSRLHTLAAWWSGHDSVRLDRPWHLQYSTCVVEPPGNLQTRLPAVRRLDALVLNTVFFRTEDVHAVQAVMQLFAGCAERWAWRAAIDGSKELQVLQGMPPSSLAALKHAAFLIDIYQDQADTDVALLLGSLVSAAPNITTLAMHCSVSSYSTAALTAMMQPLRRAAHLRTLWLAESQRGMVSSTARQATLLEGVVRCLAQPCAEGGDEYCRALRHVLLAGAQPDALAACRAALARDGICVSVGTCTIT